MSFIEPHTLQLLKHAVGNLLAAVGLFGAAVALDFAEHWCAHAGVSPWLVTGIGVVAKITFALDAVLFLSIVGLTAAHFVRNYFRRVFDE